MLKASTNCYKMSVTSFPFRKLQFSPKFSLVVEDDLDLIQLKEQLLSENEIILCNKNVVINLQNKQVTVKGISLDFYTYFPHEDAEKTYFFTFEGEISSIKTVLQYYIHLREHNE